MKTNNQAILLAAAILFAAAVRAADTPWYFKEETMTLEDGTEKTISRPMTAAEFDAYIESNYGPSAASEADIESAREAWNAARREWNDSPENADHQIAGDEDENFDYGDEDDGEGHHGGEGEFKDEDIEKLFAMRGEDDKDDDRGIGYAEEGKIAEEDIGRPEAERLKALEDDDDGYEGQSSGNTDTVTLENTDGDSDSARKFTVEFAKGFDPSKRSLNGLFDGMIEALPLVKESDDAAKELIGWKETNTTTKIVGSHYVFGPPGGFSSYGSFNWLGWNRYWDNYSGGPSTITETTIITHEGELDNIDVDTPGWDWEGLREIDGSYADEMNFTALDWTFGGLDGSDYKWGSGGEVPVGPVIGDLKFSRDGLSFRYENDLSAWGLEYDEYDGENGGAIACLFVKDNDGKWVGGKFDWISSSRNTRGFENVFSGYEGWNLENVPQTTEAAFVIVSRDGKWRSNVAVAQWER